MTRGGRHHAYSARAARRPLVAGAVIEANDEVASWIECTGAGWAGWIECIVNNGRRRAAGPLWRWWRWRRRACHCSWLMLLMVGLLREGGRRNSREDDGQGGTHLAWKHREISL